MKKLILAAALAASAAISLTTFAQVEELPPKDDKDKTADIIVNNNVPVPEVNVTVPTPNVQVTNDVAAPEVYVDAACDGSNKDYLSIRNSGTWSLPPLPDRGFMITDISISYNTVAGDINNIFGVEIYNGNDPVWLHTSDPIPEGQLKFYQYSFTSGVYIQPNTSAEIIAYDNVVVSISGYYLP